MSRVSPQVETVSGSMPAQDESQLLHELALHSEELRGLIEKRLSPSADASSVVENVQRLVAAIVIRANSSRDEAFICEAAKRTTQLWREVPKPQGDDLKSPEQLAIAQRLLAIGEDVLNLSEKAVDLATSSQSLRQEA